MWTSDKSHAFRLQAHRGKHTRRRFRPLTSTAISRDVHDQGIDPLVLQRFDLVHTIYGQLRIGPIRYSKAVVCKDDFPAIVRNDLWHGGRFDALAVGGPPTLASRETLTIPMSTEATIQVKTAAAFAST